MVDLGGGEHAQRFDRGQRGEPLALLQGAVVGGCGDGEREGGRGTRAGGGLRSDVLAQSGAQAVQHGLAVVGGLREDLDGNGVPGAGQPSGGVENGDGST